jgi:epoxyqueuosine reductase
MLTEWVKAQARGLGFEAVGVAPIEEPDSAAAFRSWLQQGYHAEMAYLARTAEARLHPAVTFPWARSVVTVALPYHTPFPPPPEEEGARGWISRHAWGADYRDVVRGKLELLLTRIRGEAGSEIRGEAHTDPGPTLERAIAVRAGIGWAGKNTLVLSSRLGSYFVLGELFLSVPLEPDGPMSERCGQCRSCLEACPTRALVGPRVLDARRCISYLTIELKGPIPRELRPLIGPNIFGCDICQEVCPYNARRAVAADEAFRPRPGLCRPELIPLLELTEAGFRERFQGSAILRTKRRGLLRNVCVALGNLALPAAIPALDRTLERDAEPLVRAHAAWALGRIRDPRAEASLERALGAEPHPQVREEIETARRETAGDPLP